jgi:demethylmenaquinone methyltransferase/2-methoxy-6-polyprenyl-1,4-benzoquinol methylase
MQRDWLFHCLAPFYDHLIRKPQVDRLKKLLDLPPNGIIVDAGGGTGRVSKHLKDITANVCVCDINRSMLKQTQRRKNLLPLQADAANLPFPANSIDAILIVDALHHFTNPEKAVLEILRVLKPGGRLLIEEQDIERIPIKVVQFSERRLGLQSRFLTLKEILALFDSINYTYSFEKGTLFTLRVLVRKLE